MPSASGPVAAKVLQFPRGVPVSDPGPGRRAASAGVREGTADAAARAATPAPALRTATVSTSASRRAPAP